MRAIQGKRQRKQASYLAVFLAVAVIIMTLYSSGCSAVVSGAGGGSSGEVKARSTLTVTTSSLNPGSVGKTYSATLQATGGTGVYDWSVASGALPLGLQLEASTGVISGVPISVGTSSFTVQATDTVRHTAQKPLNASVNAATPESLATSKFILATATVGSAYASADQASGGTPPYTWSVSSGRLPPGLALSRVTGNISGTPTASGAYNFTLKVEDSSSPAQSASSSFTISVSPHTGQSLTSSGSILASATVGTPYTSTGQAAGGTLPYTWSVSAGQLPPGLVLTSSTGNVSGTPTTSGTYYFTLLVADSSSPRQFANSSFTISVSARTAQNLSISGSYLASATVGTPYTSTGQCAGGTPPYTWSVSAGKLPPGLVINSSTGNISGTPTALGAYNFTLRVTDSSSAQLATTASFTISVAARTAQTLSIPGSILAGATISTTYTSTAQATGGTLPYTWTVSAGQLPGGLALASTTGTISGTPSAAGTFNFTLKVADSSSSQQTASNSFTIIVSGNLFDQYGGFTTMPSPNPSTGIFRVEKFGNKWMFVDPADNAFFIIGIYVFNEDQSVDNLGSSYYARTAAKYGDNGPTWATAQLKRIQSWGFNTSGPYASAYVLPTTVSNAWSTQDHTDPIKTPFIGLVRPAYYGMLNENNWSPQPIKNMLFGLSPYYTGYEPGNGVADYYDSNLETFFTNEMTDPAFAAIKSSPHKEYLIGMNVDDGDQMYGFGNGPDFVTGHSNAHLGWLVLTMSPVQSANNVKRFVYTDPLVYSKKALHDQLLAQYGTISALNSAWGSSYTSFDSSGALITGQTIATGTGSTLAFTGTLANPIVSAFSLQILVAGQPVGGDTGDGKVWGPNLSGTVDYSTGAFNLVFGSGHAPLSGAPITANYVQNGWGIGSGLMDEDGRSSHRAWVGIDYTFMKDVNAKVKLDLDSYLYQIAAHYFSMSRNVLQSWMPGVMYLGPDSLGTWGAPSNRNVLKAAAQYIDVMEMGGGGTALSQPMLDFIYSYYGDKPIYIGEFRTANADSALSSYGDSGIFATQQSRGQNYLDTVTTYPTASYTANSSRPYVGFLWWQYLDNWGEKLNWGLVTLMDNAYDGHESVTGSGGLGVRTVPCTPPLELYVCGGEQKNFGDVITPVTKANQQVMQKVQH